jgi:hypothetical protein
VQIDRGKRRLVVLCPQTVIACDDLDAFCHRYR